ncbi:MAG: cupin domain-containing protein [Pseudomonadota bacterium]
MGPLERSYVVRRQNRRNLNLLYDEPVEQSGYSDELLSSSIGGGFHMGLSEYPPYNAAVTVELYSRFGEQHGYVLEGELVLTLEDEDITVRAGDSFSFPGQILHGLRNVSDATARLIWVNSPVIISKNAALDATVNEAPSRQPDADPDARRRKRTA